MKAATGKGEAAGHSTAGGVNRRLPLWPWPARWARMAYPRLYALKGKGYTSLRSHVQAGVGEWLKPPDCKSGAKRLRRFESYPLHHAEDCETGAPEPIMETRPR